MDMFDFSGMTPEQKEARCYMLLGIRKKTPEELAELEDERQRRYQWKQARLEERYNDGDEDVFRRRCPVCGTVFYTTNRRRVYDDYYKCSRYYHRSSARFKRMQERITTCQKCGKSFIPARKGAKYCCAACKQKAYRERKQCGQNDHTEQP